MRDEFRNPVLRNGYALIFNTGANGLLGVLYWIVASRRYSAEVIGRDTALIAALQTLSTLAQLDLASLLMKFLPTWRDNAARALRMAYLLAASTSMVMSFAFVMVAPRLSDHWAFLRPFGVAAPLCCGVALWSVFAIEDGALTGLRRATLIPVENSAFGVAKLALVATFAHLLPDSGVLWSWLLALIPVALAVNWFLFRRALPAHRNTPMAEGVMVFDRRRVIHYAGYDYVGAMCATALTFGMPLLVTGLLGADAAAIFYFPWMIILLLDSVAVNLGASLIVEGTTDPSQLVRHARSVLRRAAILLVPSVIAVEIFASNMLQLFGSTYAREGTTTLRILALAVLCRAIVNIYTSVARVQLKVAQILLRVLACTALVIAFAIVLGRRYGVEGVAAGLILGSVLEVSVIGGPLWRVLRLQRTPAASAKGNRTTLGPRAERTEVSTEPPTQGPRRLLGESPLGPRALLCGALAAAGAASATTLAVSGSSPAILALVTVLLVPGVAVTSRLRISAPLTELLLAVTMSAAITVIGGEAMLTLHWWQPRLWVTVLGGTAALALAQQAASLLLERSRSPGPASIKPDPRAPIRLRRTTLAASVFPGLCAATVVFWAMSLPKIDPSSATDTGLIGRLPVIFFLALASLTAAFCLALARRHPRSAEVAVVVGLLIVVLFATAPLIAAMPRYTYVYKHLGVASYLNLHGGLAPTIDIYQNWPGFLALLAVLERVGGISGLTMAAWGQVAFAAIDVLAVRYAVRGLTSDPRVVALAMWLYLLFDWVGQNYLSPEAFGFAITVTAVGVVLHHLGPPERQRPLAGYPEALVKRVSLPGRSGPDGPPISRSAAVRMALSLSAAVVVSHQLAPVMLACFLVVLVLTKRCTVWWLPVMVVALIGAQYGSAWAYLRAHNLIFSGFGHLMANASGTSGGLPGSGGHLAVQHAARVLSLGVWAGSALSAAVQLWRGRWDSTTVGLVVVPFWLLAAQSYGGEIIYRVFLFTTPWCAYLIANALVGHRQVTPSGQPARMLRSEIAAVLAVCSLAIPLWLTAFYGLYRSDYVRPSELAGWDWFASHASKGSVLDYVSGNFPANATGNYDDFESADGSFGTDVVSQPAFEGRTLGPADVSAVIRSFRQHDPGRQIYVALSAGQESYAEAFGQSPVGNVDRFEQMLRNDPAFAVVFQQGSTTLLHLLPAEATG